MGACVLADFCEQHPTPGDVRSASVDIRSTSGNGQSTSGDLIMKISETTDQPKLFGQTWDDDPNDNIEFRSIPVKDTSVEVY